MKTHALVSVALLAVCSFSAARARAASPPTITGIAGPIQRLEPDGSSADAPTAHPHADGVPVDEIDAEDCQANLAYQFDLSIDDLDSAYDLDVWAGTQDCTLAANRNAATAVCWPVVLPAPMSASPAMVRVRAQDVVSQATLTTPTVTYTPATSSACSLQTTSGPTNVKLYFFFESNGVAAGTPLAYPMILDTLGAPFVADDGGIAGSDDAGTVVGGNGASDAGAIATGSDGGVVVTPAPGGGNSGSSSGCATSPRAPNESLGLAVAVAAIVLARRRRARSAQRH